MKHIALLLSVVAAACGGSGDSKRDAYAVGGYIGTGSVLGAGPDCTYEVTPASAAELSENKRTGKLLAPGKGTTTCKNGHKDEWDIVAADHVEIRGDLKLAVGKEGRLQAQPFAGKRELLTSGHFEVEWTPAPDCTGILASTVDTPAGGDSLRGSYSLETLGKAKGSCTVTAVVVGQKTTQTVTIN